LPNRIIYTASRIFTGDSWLPDHAIIVKEGFIESILPLVSLPAGVARKDFPNAMIVPAFIDAQIYGGNGKLFAAYPEPDALSRLVAYCRSGGAAYCLPTVATNTKEVFLQCINAVRDYWHAGGEGILGLHLEGPWINPLKRGAHVEPFIHAPGLAEVRELLKAGKDIIKVITLAPEVCSREVLDLICSENIIISAGHSNATYAEAMNGFTHHIGAVTHLYNAMSPLLHRAPGLVGAALNNDKVMVSIIPDGHHVDYAAIHIAKQVLRDRLFVITDAVTETNQGPYPHQLAGDKYESGGVLSGSALTMQKALYNLVHHVNIGIDEALRMCSLYPARMLGLDQQSGRIRPGYKADMVALNDKLDVVEMI
jgi:N-acetylglucosamine-6-phosphate deacetylase